MKILIRAAGWLLSALGLLSVIEQLDFVRLSAQAEAWLGAFRLLTQRVQPLFSWVDWGWVKLDRYEVDAFMIASVFVTAKLRAYVRSSPDLLALPNRVKAISLLLTFFIIYTIYFLVPCLLLPGPLGVVAMTSIIILNMAPMIFRRLKWGKANPPPIRLFAEEFGGAATVLIGLIVVSELTK